MVGGVFFSLSKKSGCSLPAFRSWDCLFFLFEIETLETSLFRAWKEEKEKTSSGLPLAWGLWACLFFDLSLCLQAAGGEPWAAWAGLLGLQQQTLNPKKGEKDALAVRKIS